MTSNINEIENNLNTALGRIYDWRVRNKLTINANKTKSMPINLDLSKRFAIPTLMSASQGVRLYK